MADYDWFEAFWQTIPKFTNLSEACDRLGEMIQTKTKIGVPVLAEAQSEFFSRRDDAIQRIRAF